MPIKIGQKLESDFRNPLGLLSDCHRRIERFLNALITIAEKARGQQLDNEQRQHFETALRYFREAAPKHTQDEEESLFPRLRLHQTAETEPVFVLLDRLHSDHLDVETQHQRVDKLGRRWLADGSLSSDDAALLANLLKQLQQTYREHIAFEDNELFPFAEQTLEPSDLEAVAREMAKRRGLVT